MRPGHGLPTRLCEGLGEASRIDRPGAQMAACGGRVQVIGQIPTSMKTIKLLLPLAAVVLAVVTAQAAEKKAAKTASCCDDGCAAKQAKVQKKIVITGTHIPVVPTIAGNTYVNTVQPVRVITRADLDRSGAQSLGQFLGNRATLVGH